MRKEFPGGVWPVMLTPFKENEEVDYKGLEALVNWYINKGVDGLFAVCQSSEMFKLTLEERFHIGETVVKTAAGRVPVIVSGHISNRFEDQAEEIEKMAETGADAVIMITNRLASEEESDEIWRENCAKLLEMIDTDIPLGFYECPYPYKRVISEENLKWCADTGRFYFLKDTCCDAEIIRRKLEAIKGSRLKLYNANTATLLESLKDGAAGYSGVMANFHPTLYTWLCRNSENEKAEEISDILTLCALIERQCYPVNAKWGLREIEHLPITDVCRVKNKEDLTETFRKEVRMMDRVAARVGRSIDAD